MPSRPELVVRGMFHTVHRYQVQIPRCPQKWAKFSGSVGFSGNGVPGRKSSLSTFRMRITPNAPHPERGMFSFDFDTATQLTFMSLPSWINYHNEWGSLHYEKNWVHMRIKKRSGIIRRDSFKSGERGHNKTTYCVHCRAIPIQEMSQHGIYFDCLFLRSKKWACWELLFPD